MARLFGLLFAVLILAAAAPGAAFAQINAPSAVQSANLTLALHNLDAMIEDARRALPAKPRTEREQAIKDAAAAELDRLRAIHTNLSGKLARGELKAVPDLHAGRPRKYREGGQQSSPWAAYCDDQTEVRDGDAWVRCREGDILIDGGVLDPGGGTAIDETTDAGWRQKYTLLHIISHEKMHELIIEEQLRQLMARPWWGQKTEAERARLIAEAERAGATTERHQEVYEWQKNVLRWKREQLRRQQRELEAVRPPDRAAIDVVKGKIKWLEDEVKSLEGAMRRATGDFQFAPWERCGWPRGVGDGLLRLYVTAPGLYWRLDGILGAGGGASQPTVGEVFWMGQVEPEAPLAGVPANILVMSQETFTGAHVQPDPCDFLRSANRDRIARVADPAALEGILSEATGYPQGQAAEPQRQEQAPALLEGRTPIVVGPNSQVGSGARARAKAASAAMGVLGGLLGGGGGGGGRDDGPKLASCKVKDRETTVLEDPASASALRLAARRTGRTVTVFADVERSPDSGTFQTAFLQNQAGEMLAPSNAEICDLWGEWKLTVSWTRSSYVDGQLVSRESGGWSRAGRLDIPGLHASAGRPDGLWRRLGFSNASHGARRIKLTFPAPPGNEPLDLVVHLTRPAGDPVTTVPFVASMQEAAGRIDLAPVQQAASSF